MFLLAGIRDGSGTGYDPPKGSSVLCQIVIGKPGGDLYSARMNSYRLYWEDEYRRRHPQGNLCDAAYNRLAEDFAKKEVNVLYEAEALMKSIQVPGRCTRYPMQDTVFDTVLPGGSPLGKSTRRTGR